MNESGVIQCGRSETKQRIWVERQQICLALENYRVASLSLFFFCEIYNEKKKKLYNRILLCELKTRKPLAHSILSLKLLVRLLLPNLPSLDREQCNWQVEKSRESCLRIVSFRHFSPQSFTLECSLGGSNHRPLKVKIHFFFSLLQKM